MEERLQEEGNTALTDVDEGMPMPAASLPIDEKMETAGGQSVVQEQLGNKEVLRNRHSWYCLFIVEESLGLG